MHKDIEKYVSFENNEEHAFTQNGTTSQMEMSNMCHYENSSIASNINTVLGNLASGQIFHIDFAFMSETIIRVFSSYLSFLDDTTGYPFYFPTWNKRAPLDIFQLIISTLCQQNQSINYVRYDKGG